MQKMPDNGNDIREMKGFCKLLILCCLITKPLIFYILMNFHINFFFIWAATSLVLVFFFGSFRRILIPVIFYILITALMFADVTFNAYFNGYLSVGMLGSSKYLGDVWDIIIEIVKPEFFILLFDLPVLIFIIIRHKLSLRDNNSVYVTGNIMSESKIREIVFGSKGRFFAAAITAALIALFVFGGFTGSRFLQSISNLEFFSYHIKDVLRETIGFGRYNLSDLEAVPYEPDEEDKLFGIAEGRNLILIQMEALQNFVINTEYEGQEITPVLNKLISDKSTLYFDRYYMQIAAGNTSDAEFATNNSLYGTVKSYTYEIYKNNTFRGLPVLLKGKGYDTIAMHGYDGSYWSRNVMYPAQGFDTFLDDKFYEPTAVHGWGIIDEEFFRQSVDYLKNIDGPFYGFMVSLSNHTPFKMEEKYCRIELAEKHLNTRFGNYLNSVAYSDYALGVFIDELKKAGIYENSVIAVYGDHFGLAQNDEDNEELMTEFLRKPYRFDEMANIPLIIHIPGSDINRTISVAGGQLDFLPTIAYLMGFESLDTMYLGQNLIKADKGFVIQSRYAPAGSFIMDDIIYFMSVDGVFENGEAWHIDTGKRVSVNSLKPLSERAKALIDISEKFLEEDAMSEWEK